MEEKFYQCSVSFQERAQLPSTNCSRVQIGNSFVSEIWVLGNDNYCSLQKNNIKLLLNHDCTKDLRTKEGKVVLHLNSNLTWHDIGDICYGDKNEYKN